MSRERERRRTGGREGEERERKTERECRIIGLREQERGVKRNRQSERQSWGTPDRKKGG